MTSINELLHKRHTRLLGRPGNIHLARQRLPISKYIASHFIIFDDLRSHLFHRKQHPKIKRPRKARKLLQLLKKQGWIIATGPDSWTINSKAKINAYLSGGWLEELVYFAHLEAGCDEAYFAQTIEWKVNKIHGRNEIDIIARRGNTLSFTSCKTIGPHKSPKHMSQLRKFLTETDYWNIHFANDQGRALLVVTADFIDELRKRHRYPQLLSRSAVLDVSIIGLEQLKWSQLVNAVKEHWLKQQSVF
jgi:hypothetical protein